MQRPHYLDPLGSRLPALESNMVRLRSLQMLLVLFYAEQLKRTVLNLIQGSDQFRARLSDDVTERFPKGAKGQLKKCLQALVDDGAISGDEKEEIRRLIDYRNVIGHDIQELVGDLSTARSIRHAFDLMRDDFTEYDYEAVDRLRHYLKLLGEQRVKHRYILTISLHPLMFRSAERTLLVDIQKLKAKIRRQAAKRTRQIRELNDQLNLDTNSEAESDPRHPLNQYDDKRLTLRGEEVCYRLFDQGKPPMAVAHLMGISLASATKRQRMWQSAGGVARPMVDLESLPKRKFYRRHGDD